MDTICCHSNDFIIMIMLLLASAFFSGSETALFSLSKVALKNFMKKNSMAAKAVLSLNHDRPEFLSTVLFCNMLVNILFFSFSATFISDFGEEHGHYATVVLSLCSLILVIIFGEVTPKSLAVIAPEKFISVTILPMYVLHKAVYPIRSVLGKIIRLVLLITKNNNNGKDEHIDELKMLLQSASEEGELSKIESTIINELIDFSDIKLKEFMTPRVDIIMTRDTAKAEEVIELARESGRTKIPLYKDNRDNIIGIIDISKIFLNNIKGNIRKYIQPIYYLSEYQRADTALKFFIEKKTNIAIVVDEYGGTAGIVTYGDVVEEIFGEGSFDEEMLSSPLAVKKISDNEFIVSGRLSVRDWKNLLGYSKDLPVVDTVGGLITSVLGKVPASGDAIEIGRVKMVVRKVAHNRVVSAKLEIIDENIDIKGG